MGSVEIPDTITLEFEGAEVTGRCLLEGSVLTVKTDDGRLISQPIRSTPAAFQLRLMFKTLLEADPADPSYRPGFD